MEQRLRALLALPAVLTQAPPLAPDPAHDGDPGDLAAFYAACDGLTLVDGTTLLGRAEAARATAWLIEEKSLHWSDELLLLGERDDLVIVRDADRQGTRAGGGVLEAPTDGLSSFKRVSLDLASYLELRAGVEFGIESTAFPGYPTRTWNGALNLTLTVMDGESGVMSIEFKVNLLAPAAGDRFLVRGEVLKAGKTVVVCRGDAFALDGERPRLIAAMQGSMMAVRNREGVRD